MPALWTPGSGVTLAPRGELEVGAPLLRCSDPRCLCPLQVFTFGWREDIRVGDPMHTKKVCFDAISHNSPVTLYDCHGMKGNQLWRYRKVRSLFLTHIPTHTIFFQV